MKSPVTVDMPSEAPVFLSPLAWEAIGQAVPIGLCYFPVSVALGVLADQLGFSAWQALFMPMISFSGSGESVVLQMLALGESTLVIAITNFVINLRYSLYSLTLAPHARGMASPFRYLLSLGMVDETFAVLATRYREQGPQPLHFIILCFFSQSFWIAGRAVGFYAGRAIGDVQKFGLDCAVPAMFIGLLVMSVRDRKTLVLSLGAAALCIVLKLTPLSSWAVFASGVLCAALMVGYERWTAR